MSNEGVLKSSDRSDKRIHVALPVRVTHFDSESKPRLEIACTYDISAHGARVTGLRCVKDPGEIVVIERGRSKAYCRVVWIGQANSHLQGQVGIQCVEAQKSLWTAELRDMEEMYDPMTRDVGCYRLDPSSASKGNRRRYQRFAAEGTANLLQKGSASGHLEGGLKDVSEVGCRVATKTRIVPGTDLKLVLMVSNYDLSFKGQVRHAAEGSGLGIEFREVRKGDRAVLQHMLRKLAEKENDTVWGEVTVEQQSAISAGGMR